MTADPGLPEAPRSGLVRGRVHADTETAAGLGVAAMVSNVIALIFTVVFARVLGTVDYGSLAPLVSAFLIVGIVGSALQIVVAREVSLELRDGDPRLRSHIRSWIYRSLQITAAVIVIGILLRNQIASLIGVDDLQWAAASVLVTGVAWFVLSILRGVMQGLQRYRPVGWSLIGEAAGRLAFGLILVTAGLGATGAFLASAASMVTAALALAYLLYVTLEHGLAVEGEGGSVHRDWGLGALTMKAWPALLTLGLLALLQNSDVIMVKRMAPADLAGAYAADAVAAKVVVWLAIGLGMYVVPEVARHGRGRDAAMVLVRSIGLLLLAGAAMIVCYELFGKTLLKIGFGEEFTIASSALPVLGIAMTLLSVGYLVCQYLLALEQKWFLFALALAVIAQLAILSQVASSAIDTAVAMMFVQGALATVLLLGGLRLRRSDSLIAE